MSFNADFKITNTGRKSCFNWLSRLKKPLNNGSKYSIATSLALIYRIFLAQCFIRRWYKKFLSGSSWPMKWVSQIWLILLPCIFKKLAFLQRNVFKSEQKNQCTSDWKWVLRWERGRICLSPRRYSSSWNIEEIDMCEWTVEWRNSFM